jgi:hypothetical protein
VKGNSVTSPDLQNRFTYHPPTDEPILLQATDDGATTAHTKPQMYEAIRAQGLTLATLIDWLAPPCRETSLAVTKIEEAVMWANAAIARHRYAGLGVGGPIWQRIE